MLLGLNVFYPFEPPVRRSVQRTLNAETAAAKRAGFPIKVALIASPLDLGVIPSLFGKPQQYADFLDQEISFLGKQPLLVVMSDGYGTQGFGGPAKLAVAAPAPAGRQDQHRPGPGGDHRGGPAGGGLGSPDQGRTAASPAAPAGAGARARPRRS